MRRQELSAQPLARQSAPQYYAPAAQDPCADDGLNQNANQGFNLYNEPLKYAQKGNYYNPESLQKNEFVGPPEFSGEALVGGNYNNPDIRPTSTLINNETGEGYNFKNGGGKKKEKKGTVLEVNPENVTADGSQVLEYPNLLPEVVVEDKLDRTNPTAVKNWSRKNDPIAYAARKSGSDFMSTPDIPNIPNFMPSNAKAYMQGILGRKEDFTEADLTQSEIDVMGKIVKDRKKRDKYLKEQIDAGYADYDQDKNISYDDFNRYGASKLSDATPRHLSDPASRMKTLLGKSSVTEHPNYYQVGPNAYDFDDYTNTPFSEMSLLNVAEHIYNQSPFIKGRKPMNMNFRIPKN